MITVGFAAGQKQTQPFARPPLISFNPQTTQIVAAKTRQMSSASKA